MKKLTIPLLFMLLALAGCLASTNSESAVRFSEYHKSSCRLFGAEKDSAGKPLACPEGEIDPFWISKAFAIPKRLPDRQSFCLTDWQATSPTGIKFQQALEKVKYYGLAGSSDSIYYPEFDTTTGYLVEYSFHALHKKPLNHYRVSRDSEFKIISIDDGQQRVEYEYCGVAMCSVKEYLKGDLAQVIAIR